MCHDGFDQRPARRVVPVGILEHEHQARVSGQSTERTRHHTSRGLGAVVRRHRRDDLGASFDGQNGRKQLGQVMVVGVEELGDRFCGRRVAGERAKHSPPRVVRGGLVERRTPDHQPPDGVRLCGIHEFSHQCGLADAGLAFDEDHAAAPGEKLLEHPPEHGPFPMPSDHRRRFAARSVDRNHGSEGAGRLADPFECHGIVFFECDVTPRRDHGRGIASNRRSRVGCRQARRQIDWASEHREAPDGASTDVTEVRSPGGDADTDRRVRVDRRYERHRRAQRPHGVVLVGMPGSAPRACEAESLLVEKHHAHGAVVTNHRSLEGCDDVLEALEPDPGISGEPPDLHEDGGRLPNLGEPPGHAGLRPGSHSLGDECGERRSGQLDGHRVAVAPLEGRGLGTDEALGTRHSDDPAVGRLGRLDRDDDIAGTCGVEGVGDLFERRPPERGVPAGGVAADDRHPDRSPADADPHPDRMVRQRVAFGDLLLDAEAGGRTVSDGRTEIPVLGDGPDGE